MIYEYRCDICNTKREIWKPAAEFDKPESCECGANLTRLITGGAGFLGEKVEHAEYNPGLGCIVKNRREREEIAKRKGLIEIGNESPNKLHSESERIRTENIKQSWEKVDV
jgi:putative FmdB family regulatory protein